jgi:hypothetical protein
MGCINKRITGPQLAKVGHEASGGARIKGDILRDRPAVGVSKEAFVHDLPWNTILAHISEQQEGMPGVDCNFDMLNHVSAPIGVDRDFGLVNGMR